MALALFGVRLNSSTRLDRVYKLSVHWPVMSAGNMSMLLRQSSRKRPTAHEQTSHPSLAVRGRSHMNQN